MTGNIYLRKDGRYEGRITIGKNEQGKRQYRAFFGKTKNEVYDKMALFLEKSDFHKNCDISFQEIYVQWEQFIRCRVKESTLANYRMKAEKHILPEFGNVKMETISTERIRQFVQDALLKKLSNRYVSDILVLMKSIFKFAVSHFQIHNPAEDLIMPKKPRTEVRLLSAEEQSRLHQYIAEHHDLTSLGIALAKATGLRIGELCALQWGDIDLEKRILTVSKTVQRIQVRNGSRKTKLVITDPKSETSCRQIPIPEFLIPFLREFTGDSAHFVLSGTEKPLEPRTMQYRFVRVLKNVNLPSVHFHALRHMFATNCVRLGFEVKALSEILGHSSVEITLNRYVHTTFQQKAEFMNRLKPE